MGCLLTTCKNKSKTLEEDDEEEPKQYSWDKRPKLDPKDYMIENLKGETACKPPGSLNGQQFIIQNCEDSNIYILDHTATVSVDECVNCNIVLGPVKSSVFIRECKDCRLLVSCQQLRTRDCHRVDIHLSCVTQPIIESSTGVKMACYQFYYPALKEQFRSADISVYNNNWSNVHDFTPVPGENNFTLLPQDVTFPPPDESVCPGIEMSCARDKSVVPYTTGRHRKLSDQSCLVIFFNDGTSQERAQRFIAVVKEKDCSLVQTKEFPMRPDDAMRVFGSEAYNNEVQKGPVIGFEFNGDGVCGICQDALLGVSQEPCGRVFISADPDTASQQIENFYNYAELQMAV